MDTATPLNIDLLSKLVRWAGQDVAGLAEEFEKEGWPAWDQATWAKQVVNGSCQTFCCIAGNAIMQTEGWGLLYDSRYGGDQVREVLSTVQRTMKMIGKDGREVEVIDPDGETEAISDAAAGILGLNPHEQVTLFSETNSLADIVFVASRIAFSRGLFLDVPASLYALRHDSDYEWHPPVPAQEGWFARS